MSDMDQRFTFRLDERAAAAFTLLARRNGRTVGAELRAVVDAALTAAAESEKLAGQGELLHDRGAEGAPNAVVAV